MWKQEESWAGGQKLLTFLLGGLFWHQTLSFPSIISHNWQFSSYSPWLGFAWWQAILLAGVLETPQEGLQITKVQKHKKNINNLLSFLSPCLWCSQACIVMPIDDYMIMWKLLPPKSKRWSLVCKIAFHVCSLQITLFLSNSGTDRVMSCTWLPQNVILQSLFPLNELLHAVMKKIRVDFFIKT